MGAVDDCQSTVQSAINAQQIAKLVHWSELNAAAIDTLPYSADDDTEHCTTR
jgi:aromatic ring-cleaving dioxygenase